MFNKSMFSSQTGEWETPASFFAVLDSEFHFTLDVCARPENAKCPRFFSPEQDGLRQSWAGEICWMNPPYGPENREVGAEGFRGGAEGCGGGLSASFTHGHPLVAQLRDAGRGNQVR